MAFALIWHSQGICSGNAGGLAYLANALTNIGTVVILSPTAIVALFAVRYPRWPHESTDGTVLGVDDLSIHFILHLGRPHPAAQAVRVKPGAWRCIGCSAPQMMRVA